MSGSESQFEQSLRERAHFRMVLGSTGVFSLEESEQFAHDLAEIAEVCRSVPSRIGVLVNGLARREPIDTRALKRVNSLIGEFGDHLPNHLAGALNALGKLRDALRAELENAGWPDHVISAANSIEIAIDMLHHPDVSFPAAAESASTRWILKNLIEDIQKTAAEVDELPEPARQQVKAKLEEWRVELRKAQGGADNTAG